MTHASPDMHEDHGDPLEPGGGAGLEEHPADPAEVVRLADRILGGLGLEVRAAARDADATIEVDLDGPDRDYLLDRRGEALDALQYLLNRIIYRGRRGKKIHLDCGGFRRIRDDEVVEIALRTAAKVRSSGKESVLSPLNPYERRLVHLALNDVAGVETRSLGDGFMKRVAIVPTGQSSDDTGRADS